MWALPFFAEVDSLRADTEGVTVVSVDWLLFARNLSSWDGLMDIVGSSVKGKDGKTHVIYYI